MIGGADASMSETSGSDGQGWQRVHPLTVIVAGIGALRQAILPIVAVLFGTQAMDGAGKFGALIVPLAILIIVLNVGGAWLGWVRLRYRMGSEDIRVEQGIVSRSARSIPYERIQDISLEAGPLARLLGLVEVRFETGAGGKDEAKLAYVARAQALALREVVRDMRDNADSDAIAAAQTAGEAPPLFRMTPGRVVLFGLFEFSLVVIAVIAGAAQQLDFLLPFDIWDLDGWEARLAGPGQWLAGLGWASRIVGVLLALAMLAGVGIATGLVRTVLRDWDFRLDRTSRGFRRRRGLLTRTDVIMPVHRVQAAIVGTGVLRRLWGWHGLSFVSLAQDAGSSNHKVAPFAQVAEIAPIVSEAGFTLPGADTNWHRPSRRYRTDRALAGSLLPFLAGLVALALAPSIWTGVALLALAALLALRQVLLWRFERHAVGGAHIVSRRGWLSPKMQIADRVKLHSVEIAQGPVAQRRGYADLRFGLAGGAMAFNGLPLSEAIAMRHAVLASIGAVDFSELAR